MASHPAQSPSSDSARTSPTFTSRLAPSPTGALHLGNARTFVVNWAMARQRGWKLILRIEDLDTPRIKPGAAAGILDTLRWLGLNWDPGEPSTPGHSGVLVQSHDLEPYRQAMRVLAGAGVAYPCPLTRGQIDQAASAPQEGAHDTPFPASLRPPGAGSPCDFDRVQAQWRERTGEPTNWRLLCPSGPTQIADELAGPCSFDVSSIVGDFVLWTKRDLPSYQLAVVVDDHRQGVTNVVRGQDLLDSAARQLMLYRALGLSARPPGEPAYAHLPLVLGPDGRRLAKRHGDTRLESYRARGVPSEAVVGLLARWSIPARALGAPRPMSVDEFAAEFDPRTLPPDSITFTPEDERWLLSHARS